MENCFPSSMTTPLVPALWAGELTRLGRDLRRSSTTSDAAMLISLCCRQYWITPAAFSAVTDPTSGRTETIGAAAIWALTGYAIHASPAAEIDAADMSNFTMGLLLQALS